MQTAATIRHWMHLLHDESSKMAHWTGHLLHERSFWGIVTVLALLAFVITLLIVYGKQVPMEEFNVPIRYGPF